MQQNGQPTTSNLIQYALTNLELLGIHSSDKPIKWCMRVLIQQNNKRWRQF